MTTCEVRPLTTLPYNLIIEKLLDLIEWTFKRVDTLHFASNERNAFFNSSDQRGYKFW